VGAGLALGSCLLGIGACSGSTEDGTGGSGGADGTGGAADGTGGAAGGSGGAVGAGGTGGAASGGAGTGGALGGAGGWGGAGGAGAVCSLPFEVGDCDAAMPVYYHNPATDSCEPRVYGGCGGNDNRFDTYAECESACGVVPTGSACEVNGIVYPDGWTGVPDPTSCNTCSCSDGSIDACTEADCPEPCPEDTVRATDCTACGPTDACLVVRTECLPACDNQDDCAEHGGFCSQGACRQLCG